MNTNDKILKLRKQIYYEQMEYNKIKNDENIDFYTKESLKLDLDYNIKLLKIYKKGDLI